MGGVAKAMCFTLGLVVVMLSITATGAEVHAYLPSPEATMAMLRAEREAAKARESGVTPSEPPSAPRRRLWLGDLDCPAAASPETP